MGADGEHILKVVEFRGDQCKVEQGGRDLVGLKGGDPGWVGMGEAVRLVVWGRRELAGVCGGRGNEARICCILRVSRCSV